MQLGSAARVGDTPLVGDVDGDGKSDLITWHQGTDEFHWLTSSSGYNYAAAGGYYPPQVNQPPTISAGLTIEAAGQPEQSDQRLRVAAFPQRRDTWSTEMEYMLMIYSEPNGFEKLSPSQQAEGLAAITGATLSITHDTAQALDGAHAVYTDVWASMGQEAEAEEQVEDRGAHRSDQDGALVGAERLDHGPGKTGPPAVPARRDHFTSGIADDARASLTKRLEKLRGGEGFSGSAPGGPSRWATERSGEWVPLRNKLVAEVQFDQISGGRFRHGTRFLRWRPDKAPRQCTMDQLEAPRAGG
jgi:hypothetical protein